MEIRAAHLQLAALAAQKNNKNGAAVHLAELKKLNITEPQLKQQVTAQFAGHPDQESLAIHAQQLWQQLGALLSAVEQSRINRPVQPIPPY